MITIVMRDVMVGCMLIDWMIAQKRGGLRGAKMSGLPLVVVNWHCRKVSETTTTAIRKRKRSTILIRQVRKYTIS